METNNENAKFIIFNSKEEYLTMRQAWKDFHSQGHAKGKWIETKHKVYDWRINSATEHLNKTKVCPLSGHHYLLYNLLRGKPAHSGFMEDVSQPTEGYTQAYHELEWSLKLVCILPNFGPSTSEGSKKWEAERRQTRFEALTKPFGETITVEHLERVLQLMQKEKVDEAVIAA